MSEDFSDLYDLGNMSDEEIRELVLQELREYPELDVDLIEVSVQAGAVTVSGRVGTEQEIQQIEQVLVDVIGVESLSNDLVLDEITRGERSEAADEAWVENRESAPQIASSGPRTSDEAAHLMENLDAEQFGTNDAQEAVERGTAYEPPDRPVQEGSTREQH